VKFGRVVFGRPFVKRFALCYQTVCLACLSVLSVCDVGVLWPNGWMDQDQTWHAGRPRPWPHCVRWDPAPLPQMAGWIKMPLGRGVRLVPSDIVLDGEPAPLPQNGAEPPIFGLCLLWPNGWMDQDATWYEGRPRAGQHCFRCGPSSTAPPQFRPMYIVAKRSPISATPEHLLRYASGQTDRHTR